MIAFECIIPETVCPKCGKHYRAPSAISRADNRTPICPDCGIRESLDSIGCTPEEQEHILELIHEYEQLHEFRRREIDE